jgi:lipopolysaccharide export system permease protein
VKLVDRYLTSELLRAVLGGIVLFWGVLFCVFELQHLIKFLVRKGYPPEAVGKLFIYYLPQDLGWVLPIAVIFGVILAIGRLSGDGELIAMHAGGISFRRMMLPVALVGLVGVLLLYLCTETLGPRGLARAEDIVRQNGSPDQETDDFTYAQRQHGKIVLRVDAARLDTANRVLYGVTVTRYQGDHVWQAVTAESAVWVGSQLTLTRPRMVAGGLQGSAATLTFDVGAVPLQVDPTVRPQEEMTVAELRERVRALQAVHANPRQYIRPLEQQIAVRRANPWCALGLALVSAPLGIRRVRTTTGVSIGLAVLVFIPYYFVAFTLQVIGKHGGIPPFVSAWTANILVYLVAAGLIFDSSR